MKSKQSNPTNTSIQYQHIITMPEPKKEEKKAVAAATKPKKAAANKKENES